MDDVTTWLLEGDPAIRWQTMRDLLEEPESVWKSEQARVATTGWGARLLSHQDDTGRWTPRIYGHKWISTTYSIVLLRRMGLPPGDPRAGLTCRILLDEGSRGDGGIDVSVSLGRSETCATGMVLALLAWFEVDDPRTERLVDYLLAEQMPDGGWNCDRFRGAVHSSFHTTINVLEGLREYAAAGGARSDATRAAEAQGRQFFLEHRLFRSHRNGEVVDDRMLRLSFPPRWRHDILRGLEYFRAADAAAEERIAGAVEVLMGKQRRDGRWPLQQRYPGRTWFEMEQVGQPSRWNTLRARRVLAWWDGSG